MKLPTSVTSRDQIPRRALVQALAEMRVEVMERLAVAPADKDVRILQGQAQVLASLVSQLSV